jgi:hypothetical protein
MPQGTPQQNQEVRHRGNVFNALCLALVASLFGGAIGAYHFFKDTATPILVIGGFFLFNGFMVFAISYYRCPVCKHTLPRGRTTFGKKHCGNCDTTFNA